jgi:hypothetical protein
LAYSKKTKKSIFKKLGLEKTGKSAQMTFPEFLSKKSHFLRQVCPIATLSSALRSSRISLKAYYSAAINFCFAPPALLVRESQRFWPC